uniref:MATE family efflux transporter n=1 Tax=candidate division WOR-3 bacterium TaxID=2052148 RepID=A0A7C2K3I0_UNCW3
MTSRFEKIREDILTQDPLKLMWKLSLPLVVLNFVHLIYNLTDTFWLGRLGRTAVSSPTLSWPVFGTIMSLGMGFGIAGFAFISQYQGSGEFIKAQKAMGNLFTLFLMFSILAGTTGFIFTPSILKTMKIPPDTFDNTVIYLRIMFASIPFSFLGFAFSFALRALGDTRTPTFINILGMILNVALDPILIYGLWGFPKMGVLGAALATAISNFFSSLLVLRLIQTGKMGLKMHLSDLKPDLKLSVNIITKGLPASIGQSLNSLGFVFLVSIISKFGSVAVAAYSIGDRIIQLIFTISDAINQALGSILGQNLGIKNFSRVKEAIKKAVLLNAGVISFFAIFIYLGRGELISIFIKDPQVILEGKNYIEKFIVAMPFFGVFGVFSSLAMVSGRTTEGMALGLIRLWVLRIPMAYYFGKLYGTTGVWIGMNLSNIIACLMAYLWYLRGTWKKTLV